MKYSFKESKVFLEKDKRLYTTSGGIELDLTWKPSIIDKLYKEYATIQAKVVDEYPRLQEGLQLLKQGKPEGTEYVTKYMAINDEYRSKEIEIIITALKANDMDVDEKWILENLVNDETSIIVSIIMGIEESIFADAKKKK